MVLCPYIIAGQTASTVILQGFGKSRITDAFPQTDRITAYGFALGLGTTTEKTANKSTTFAGMLSYEYGSKTGDSPTRLTGPNFTRILEFDYMYSQVNVESFFLWNFGFDHSWGLSMGPSISMGFGNSTTTIHDTVFFPDDIALNRGDQYKDFSSLITIELAAYAGPYYNINTHWCLYAVAKGGLGGMIFLEDAYAEGYTSIEVHIGVRYNFNFETRVDDPIRVGPVHW